MQTALDSSTQARNGYRRNASYVQDNVTRQETMAGKGMISGQSGASRFISKAAVALVFAAAAQMLTGCAGFFVYPGTSTTSTTGSSSTSDYAFISNSTSGETDINGYAVSNGALTATTGSPASLGYIPTAMAVTPNNSYLYVASSSGGIYGYSIASDGALNGLNSNQELASDDASSIDIAPDGNWLVVAEAPSVAATSTTFNLYAISSSGALTQVQGSSGAPLTNQNPYNTNNAFGPVSIRFAPSGDFIAASMGVAGALVYAFNESTGAITASPIGIDPGSITASFNAIAIDANNYLYLAGTILNSGTAPGIEAYAVSSAGVPSSNPVSSLSAGTGPIAIQVSSNSNFVYVASSTASTISAFSTSSGQLTALNSGIAYAAPYGVQALGRDNSGDDLIAAGYSTTSGVATYTIGASGTLTQSSTAGTGATVDIPTVIAMTH